MDNLILAKKLVVLACELLKPVEEEEGGFYPNPQKSPKSIPHENVEDIRNYLSCAPEDSDKDVEEDQVIIISPQPKEEKAVPSLPSSGFSSYRK